MADLILIITNVLEQCHWCPGGNPGDLSDPVIRGLKLHSIEDQLIIKDAGLFRWIPQLLIHTRRNIFRTRDPGCVWVLWIRSIPAWTLAKARNWAWPAHHSQFGPQELEEWLVSRRHLASLKNTNRGKPLSPVPCLDQHSCMDLFVVCFVNTNNAWVQSTHLQLEDKSVLPCTASRWLF